MSGASGKGKGKGKGSDPIVWPGPYGPDWYPPPLDNFPLQGRKDFNREARLRPYDNRKEEWPKCCHGDNCIVQMYDGGLYGGRRFFRCPRGLTCDDEDNCNFTRWVDPPPIYPYEEYIQYLQNRIFDLEREVELCAMATPKDEEEEGQDVSMEDKPICNDPYCKCTCHGDVPPPPPPPPPAANWYGEGYTQLSSQQSVFSGCEGD